MICYHQRLGGRPTPPPPGQCCPGFCSVPRATCPSSYYCAFASAKTLCPAGFRCPAGASAPANCTVGYYCPVATFQPILCGTGSYCQVGSAAPAYCQEGYYCPSPATQIVCPLGSFCVRGAVTYKACTGLATGQGSDRDSQRAARSRAPGWTLTTWSNTKDGVFSKMHTVTSPGAGRGRARSPPGCPGLGEPQPQGFVNEHSW